MLHPTIVSCEELVCGFVSCRKLNSYRNVTIPHLRADGRSFLHHLGGSSIIIKLLMGEGADGVPRAHRELENSTEQCLRVGEGAVSPGKWEFANAKKGRIEFLPA